jgi:membrane protease YdiL (CAAX protease family)
VSDAPPLPSPLGAGLLTLFGSGLTFLGWALLAPDTGHALALALGLSLGFGGVGTLAARSIPAPIEERLGLRGFAPLFLLPILLFLPSLVLGSELDNYVRPLFPSVPLPEEGGPTDPDALRLATLEFAIATALLRPVIEEFFFRGVIQQGAVAHLGAAGGVAYTAALYGFASGGLELPFGPDRAASAAVQAAFAGLLLGLLRQASGSLLAPMVAACALESLGIASVAVFAETFPIPGYNASGPHTPLAVLAPCAAAVALGVWLAAHGGRRPEPEPPARR